MQSVSLSSQVSYMILQRVSPVTHSIGNCLKRVIVIVASVIVFQNPMSRQNMIGATHAVAQAAGLAHSGWCWHVCLAQPASKLQPMLMLTAHCAFGVSAPDASYLNTTQEREWRWRVCLRTRKSSGCPARRRPPDEGARVVPPAAAAQRAAAPRARQTEHTVQTPQRNNNIHMICLMGRGKDQYELQQMTAADRAMAAAAAVPQTLRPLLDCIVTQAAHHHCDALLCHTACSKQEEFLFCWRTLCPG